MRTLLAAAALALTSAVLAGCGSDEAEPPKTTRDVCPSVEAALPDEGVALADWSVFLAEVDEIAASADREAKDALDELRPGVQAMTRDAEGATFLLGSSLVGFQNRCRAAGSSAFSR